LGANLVGAQSKGLFSYVNILANPYFWTDNVTLEGNTAINTASSQNSFSFQEGAPLSDLFNYLVGVTRKHDGKVCLIFDNINYLLNWAHSPLMVLDFIQYCSSYMQIQKRGTIVALVHSDTADTTFTNSLQHRSSLCIEVRALDSGLSSDVDGEVTIYI